MFIQPDWFEVTQLGVGTNRYSYSFNDPINKMDPSGNSVWADRDGDGKNERIGSNREVFGDNHYNMSGRERRDILREHRRNGYAGVGRDNNEMAFSGSIEGIRDNVVVNPATGLVYVNGILDGGAIYLCRGGAKFCGKTVPKAVKTLQNTSVGGIKMSYHLLSVSDPKQANLIITQTLSPKAIAANASGEYWYRAGKHANRINIAPNLSWTDRPGNVVRHEVGHWFGLGHQPPGTDSIMTYGRRAPKNFSALDLGRLIGAY